MIGPGGVEFRADTRIAHESGRSASVLGDRACAHLDADAETVRRGVSTLVGRIATDWAECSPPCRSSCSPYSCSDTSYAA
jgi:hypothetical protein